MRLCIERILPPCRERAVKFILPPIESTDDISAATQAVTAALARGDIAPGEAATIAGWLRPSPGRTNQPKGEGLL
jgi:23S rRNA A2030 N6-methylase RlmJ